MTNQSGALIHTVCWIHEIHARISAFALINQECLMVVLGHELNGMAQCSLMQHDPLILTCVHCLLSLVRLQQLGVGMQKVRLLPQTGTLILGLEMLGIGGCHTVALHKVQSIAHVSQLPGIGWMSQTCSTSPGGSGQTAPNVS